ncbi:MAG: hypothetical protein HQL25_05515 [Candidatus Omnitrophica bacterium]|nr:hypothetical protein [Candidatus Omnitrophota bacterium]
MKLQLIILNIALSASIFGCSFISAPKAEWEFSKLDFDTVSEQSVSNMCMLYKNFEPEVFSKAISRDFNPDKQLFLDAVALIVEKEKVEQIKFVKDYVAAKVNVMSVTIKWEKTVTIKNSGAVFTIKGKSDLIFRRYNGDWLLNSINGDNLFLSTANKI